jgi:GNAT superfamily N-acetyltransferase
LQHRSFLLQLTLERFQPKAFAEESVSLVKATPSDESRCRFLWTEVGRSYWTERGRWSSARWNLHLSQPGVSFWIASQSTQDMGFFELARRNLNVKIEGFGLLPAWRGKGLGGGLLSAATRQAFNDGAKRIRLHTATDDHPNALPNYEARGYRIYRDKLLKNPMS